MCYLVCACCACCARSTRFQNLTCNTVGHKSAPPAINVQMVDKEIYRDPNDLVLTVGRRLVVNHLLGHVFLSDVQLQSLLDDLDRAPLTEKAPIFNENPPIVGRRQDSGTRRTLYGNYGGANHHKHNPHKLHDLPILKRVAERVLETAKKSVVGGGRMGLHHP